MWKKDFQKRTLFFNFFRFFFYISFFSWFFGEDLDRVAQCPTSIFCRAFNKSTSPFFLESSSFFFGDYSLIFKINFVYNKDEGKNFAIFYFEADRFSRSTKDRVNYYHSIWILDLIFQHCRFFFSTIYPKFLQHKLFHPLLFVFSIVGSYFSKMFCLNLEDFASFLIFFD